MDFFRKAAEKAEDVKEAVQSSSLGQDLSQLLDKLEAQAREFKEEKLKMLEEFKEEKRRFVHNFIQTKLEALFEHGMNVAAQTVKDNIKDPYMPVFVQELCDDAVDGVWPDVKMELRDQILKGISGESHLIAHGDEPSCPGKVLAFFRYNLYPYDRSFWRQLRNPVWWLFTLISLVPVYGVVQVLYILTFLLIDKGDEFQLFQFITDFKSLQFFTLGIVGSVLGSVQYYVCVTRSPSTCPTDSPRERIWSMALFIVQVVVVFIAFLMLNCSQKKGGFYYQLEQDSRKQMREAASRERRSAAMANIGDAEMSESDKLVAQMRYKSDAEMLQESKGRLMKFLIYDFVIFLICVGLGCFMAFCNFLDPESNVLNTFDWLGDGNWKFSMGLFWIKCFYGFMSFPFLALRVPLISTLISHARPTGYNPYGVTVPFLGVEENRPVPWRAGADADQWATPVEKV